MSNEELLIANGYVRHKFMVRLIGYYGGRSSRSSLTTGWIKQSELDKLPEEEKGKPIFIGEWDFNNRYSSLKLVRKIKNKKKWGE